jgi:hypothetical protein
LAGATAGNNFSTNLHNPDRQNEVTDAIYGIQ